MKNRFIITLLLCLLSGFSAIAQQWTREDFKALGIWKGLWLMKDKNGSLIETWTIKSDTLMESQSYRTKGKVKTWTETVQLVYNAGKIQYIATAIGQNNELPVAFDLIERQGKSFTFENKAHDFPRQIIYKLTNVNRLRVTINGDTPKGFKKIEFNFEKFSSRYISAH